MGLRLSLSKAYTIPVAVQANGLSVSPQFQSTAKSYFTTIVSKKSKAVRDKTGRQSQILWCKPKVFTSKREDFNLMFTNLGKEDGNMPSKKR
jgi:hypothetical protein